VKKNISKIQFLFIILISFTLSQCKFEEINQPKSAQPGEIINISVLISDDIDETANPHKGVLCVLVPHDWTFITSTYDGDIGNGIMEFSQAWADSAEKCYPASDFPDSMKWIGLISDIGYTYQNNPKVTIKIQLQTGQTEGCFDLAYLATKATQDLICTGWSPFTYPHRIGIPDSCDTPNETYKSEQALEWDNLLDRNSGWTGADGIYSISLSGKEVRDDSDSAKTLFVFSDTFIGEVDQNNSRKNAKLVNNTYAVLKGNQPLPENADFFWNEDANNKLSAIFVPETPESKPGDWYWLMDGIALNEKIYVFGLRLETGSGGIFNFAINGVTLISFTLDSANLLQDIKQVDTPLFYKNDANGWEIVFGQAVMPMHNQSGIPNADGYIYIYGPKSGSGAKKLVASRVPPDDFEDFSKWQFWDGQIWGNDISKCANITEGISQEFSVNPIDDGRFILTYQYNADVAIRFGESPVGPFGIYKIIYHAPEGDEANMFVYNAKAHPHLSEPGKLLISYNVNTFNFWDHFSNADIYRPRFINLNLETTNTFVPFEKENEIPKTSALLQNYPNPFNPETTIVYQITEAGFVNLEIFNSKGQLVEKLVDQFQNAGKYKVRFSAQNEIKQSRPSGVYLSRLTINNLVVKDKMIFIR
jgi:hypothetical protein